jgi:hypothetical protein
MRLSLSQARSGVLLAASLLSTGAEGHRSFLGALPNAKAFQKGWAGLGHVAPTPDKYFGPSGYPRNSFGESFADEGYEWTADLCRMDSDGDGRTNGQELGDPDCTWEVGMPAPIVEYELSHPGIADVSLSQLEDVAARAEDAAAENSTAADVSQYDIRNHAVSAEVFYYHYLIEPLLLVFALCAWWRRYRTAPKPSLVLMGVLTYLNCHVGTLIGSHRTYSHKATTPTRAGHLFFAFLTSWAAQGPSCHWAFYHRLHHRFCEQEPDGIALDVHSPADPNGFFWAHGWWFKEEINHVTIESEKNQRFVIPELLDNPDIPSVMKDPVLHILAHAAILASFFLTGFALTLALGNGGDHRRAQLDEHQTRPRLPPLAAPHSCSFASRIPPIHPPAYCVMCLFVV